MVYYFLRGCIMKNMFWYNLSYSIIFELLEIKTDCHDAMDIIINMSFYSLGSLVSKGIRIKQKV
jgi:hypothetical protein